MEMDTDTESLLLPNKRTTKASGIMISGYFRRRRRYHRLQDGTTSTTAIRLRRSPRRYWRIRTSPKLRWVIRSPLKILTKLKNAYMNFMLRSINTDSYIFGANKRNNNIPDEAPYYSRTDAFEARLIYEISKALVASHELYPM